MTKRTILKVLIPLICFLGTTALYAEAKEKPEWIPEISGEVAFETKYIWRGQNLGDDPVIQPGASISKYGFTFSVWGNYDTGPLDRFTEWDYIFDYTFNMGEFLERFGTGDGMEFIAPLNVSAGYIFYTFPHLDGDAFDSHEFYVGLSYDTLLQPSLTYYCDFEEGSGSYWEFGISHTFDLKNDIEAELGITTGYNAGQWGYDWSFSNMLFSGEVSVPVFEYFTVSPNVYYSLSLDDQYDPEFFGGVKISLEY